MYKYFKQLCEEQKITSFPVSATNSEGENVILMKGVDECGSFYETSTFQENGYTRINRYYKDGTTTETYER